MGKGGKQEQTSQVTTSTTTNIRDIGLTGATAVDLAEVLQTGAIESEAIRATSLDRIVQEQGKSYQQLVGGASDLIHTAAATSESIARNTAKQTESSTNLVSNIARDAQNTIRRLADRATGEKTEGEGVVTPILIVSIAALGLFMATRK